MAFLLTVVSLYLGRVAALWGLAECFSAWNLNAKTLPYAPAWAQTAAALSGEIADVFALALAAALGFSLARVFKLFPARPEPGACPFRVPRARPLPKILLFFAVGAALSLALIGLLLAVKSVRMPRSRIAWEAETLVLLLRDALLCACLPLLTRVLPFPLLSSGIGFAAISAVLQGILCGLLWGRFSPTLCASALLCGLGWAWIYRAHASCLPEIAFSFAFRAVARRAFGYLSTNGVYSVSENWLTGAEFGGLEGSGILFIVLTAAALALLYRRFRRLKI